MKIKEIKARKIYNSNGKEAIEIEVTSDVRTCTASIGSGTSVGKYEVVSYPKNIQKVIDLVNNDFNRNLKGVQINKFEDLEKIERYIKSHDFSENMEKLGGNVLVALELAVLKTIEDKPLYKILNSGKIKKMPMPLSNVIGGGSHSKGADIQEFLVLPRVKKFERAMEINMKIYSIVKEELKKRDKGFTGTRNMEGAWQTTLSNLEVLSLLKKILEKVSKEYKAEIRIGMDMAANELWNGRKYEYKNFSRVQQKKNLSKEEQIDFVKKMIKNDNLIYVEDPLHEDDFDGFEELNKEACLICGDDLIATNPQRLSLCKRKISAVIVKPNQIGSLLKTKEVIDIAKRLKIMPVMSHRSGETNDDSIAHLAVAWECPMVKMGLVGGERLSKLNELIRVSEEN